MLGIFKNTRRLLGLNEEPTATDDVKVIRVNANKAFNNGRIKFEDDGIFYVDASGKKHKGYIYKSKYAVNRYGTLPKFHLTKCIIIQDFINRGVFEEEYLFSNSKSNNVYEMYNTHIVHENQVLELCNYCRKELTECFETTQDFYENLEDKYKSKKEVKVDINGYTLDWYRISKVYREKQVYTCESCGEIPRNERDKIFWHTHHIDGNKVENDDSNLKCLCIRCHSEVDETHRKNFSTGDRAIQLNDFKRKYPKI